MVMVVAAVAVAVVAVITSEVAGRISVVRILAVRVSAALAWAGPGSVPLTSVAVISAASRAATSLTSTPRTFTDWAQPLWAPAPPGTTGTGITVGTTGATTGGAAGTVDAAAAGGSVDPSSGRSSPAIFWPSRSGRGAFTTRSGLTETCSCGMRCSGPVPSTPTARMVMFMAGMPLAARHERASPPGASLLKRPAL